ATAMGMRRRLTSIRLPGSEEPFDEWLLEYGEWGFTGWVEAALGIAEQAGRSRVPIEGLARQVKAAFEALYDEPELARSPLIDLQAVRARGGDPAQGLRSLLIETVRETESGGPRRDREAAGLLRAYYIRRVGTHEVVAERLGLPRTTFYRRQRQALELVARRLAVGEVALRNGEQG
ncbi:MAG: hypothetical protein J2P45_04460, partial [Candidatus Dormibacteraeota bacterium]|nr:hypothetical protein [Candidatus Dormibacteraeota bacterium]